MAESDDNFDYMTHAELPLKPLSRSAPVGGLQSLIHQELPFGNALPMIPNFSPDLSAYSPRRESAMSSEVSLSPDLPSPSPGLYEWTLRRRGDRNLPESPERREKRLDKNRQSAKASRLRKKEATALMIQEVDELRLEKEKLESWIQRLMEDNENLRVLLTAESVNDMEDHPGVLPPF